MQNASPRRIRRDIAGAAQGGVTCSGAGSQARGAASSVSTTSPVAAEVLASCSELAAGPCTAHRPFSDFYSSTNGHLQMLAGTESTIRSR